MLPLAKASRVAAEVLVHYQQEEEEKGGPDDSPHQGCYGLIGPSALATTQFPTSQGPRVAALVERRCCWELPSSSST
jgi:hypothetical protein